MMFCFKFSLLLSYFGILYPSSVLTAPMNTNYTVSTTSIPPDPSVFHPPELWQFPDSALKFESEKKLSSAHSDSDEGGAFNPPSHPDMFDVMIGDQPRPATSNSRRDRQPKGAKNQMKKMSEIRRSRSRYPKSQPCLKKNGKSVAFGTPPKFKQSKDQMQVLEAGYYGHRVELKCPFRKGCPKAKALWYKDGKELKGSDEKETGGPQVLISRTGESVIINDNRDYNDGNYTCVVRNLFGSISHTIKVKSTPRVVAAAPELYKNQPGNHSVEVGANLTLLCQLTVTDPGSPFNIKWFKHYQVNGSFIDPDEKLYMLLLQDSLTHLEGDGQELRLSSLREEDAGWYTCIVTNQFDSLYSTGYLEVTQVVSEAELVSEAPQTSFDFYTWLSVGLAVVVCLAGVVVTVTCLKYKREKRRKVLAVENAQCVARWTKKIFIERNFVIGAGEESGGMLSPTVRVEKVLTSHTSPWLAETEEAEDLYEFQLDEQWEFPRELLQLKEELGQGAFGRVVKAVANHSVISGLGRGCRLVRTSVPATTTVAVKMIKNQQSEQEVLDLVKEIEIMKAVGGHDNIVNLLGASTQPAGQPLLAILEYAEHGNLRDYLRKRRGVLGSSRDQLEDNLDTRELRPVTLKEMISFAYQVARGMEFLARRRCVHRDLAARNILVARGKIAKVADFGLARDVEQSDYYRRVTDNKLPVLWMSPESLFEGVSSTKSDVWSYGVLLWEIVTCGERPYTGLTAEALLPLIRDGYRMSIPIQCPQELYQIMRCCWQLEPSNRPDWSRLVTSLHSLHARTLPGVYLNLSLPSIPTPPSSPENINGEEEEQQANSPQYNNVRRAIAGIAPLPPSPQYCSLLHHTITSTRPDRSSSESGYSSSNFFQPSAPVLSSASDTNESESSDLAEQ